MTWFIYYEVTRVLLHPIGQDTSPSKGDLVCMLNYEVTRSITTPYWMGCYYYSPLNGMLVCHRVFWFLLLPPAWYDSLSQSYLVQLYTLKSLTVFVLPLVGMLVHHRVTWFIYYEVTGSISTPPGWDASP